MARQGRSRRRRLEKKYKIRRLILSVFAMVAIFFIANGAFKATASFRAGNAVEVSEKSKTAINGMILVNPVVDGMNQVIKTEQDNQKMAELEKQREQWKKEEQERLAKEGKTKVAYLTFDDGPSTKVTPRVLEILEKENVKATFFMVGNMVDANPAMVKRVKDAGHAIGHHSYSHDYKYLYANTQNFINDIEKTGKSFSKILGDDFETKLLRFPGGSFGNKKKEYVKAITKLGYKNYDWNALNGDAEGHNLSKDKLVNRTKSTVGKQKEVIILMHDTNAKGTTADALPEVIKFLKDNGYEFRTLDQK